MMTAGPAPFTPVPIVVKMPPPIIVPRPMATRSFAVSARRRILRVPSSRSFSASVVAKSSLRNDIPATVRALCFRRPACLIPDVLGNLQRVVDPSRPYEECVGKPIEIDKPVRNCGFFLIDQSYEQSLCTAANRARKVQLRAGDRTAGVDEIRQCRKLGLRNVHRAFERVRVGGPDRRCLIAAVFGQRCELAA